jgi:hypothetical protein
LVSWLLVAGENPLKNYASAGGCCRMASSKIDQRRQSIKTFRLKRKVKLAQLMVAYAAVTKH